MALGGRRGVRITIDAANALAVLAKAARGLAGNNALAVAGRTLENAWRKYYIGRGGVFWPRLGKGGAVPGQDKPSAETWGQGGTGGTVYVEVGGVWGPILQHKINGGPIRAKTAKNLAIPANAEARKKGSPRNFDAGFLRFVRFGPNGPKALVKAEKKKGKKGKRAKPGQAKPRKKPEVWYWLKESVTQKADPAALPPMGDLGAAVEKAVRDYLMRSGWGPQGHW